MHPAPERTVVVMKQGAPDASTATRAGGAQTHAQGAFVPLLLVLLGLVGSFGWQTAQLLSDRGALEVVHAGQQDTVNNASKLRASLDALAADTQRLADAGNTNAARLVTELKQRGITINAQAAAPASPAPPVR